jgi:transcriptional regulator of met regulon
MTQMISFRPDERTERELKALAKGRSVSEALREAIHHAYVEAWYARAAEDAERLRNDPDDRAEVAAVAREMDRPDAW